MIGRKAGGRAALPARSTESAQEISGLTDVEARLLPNLSRAAWCYLVIYHSRKLSGKNSLSKSGRARTRVGGTGLGIKFKEVQKSIINNSIL